MSTIDFPDLNIPEIKVLFNHIYELKKGVRRMALYTMNKKNQTYAVARVESQGLSYAIQEIDGCRINLFIGYEECIAAIRMFVDRPLNQLTPEEDFILGALLGYDVCMQCKRFCSRKSEQIRNSQDIA